MPKRHFADLHEQAFQLHLQGQSFEQIAAELNVGKSTVQRWSEGNSARGEKPWSERASAIRSKAAAATDKRAAEQISRLYDQLEDIRSEVLAELQNTKFKSKEGAIASVRSLTDMLLKLMPQRRELSDKGLQAVFQVLFSDPDLSPVLNRPKVNERIMKRIEAILKESS